jgi:trehalose-6-phosphatase
MLGNLVGNLVVCFGSINVTDEASDLSWRSTVLDILEHYTARTPYSYIEHRQLSIVRHYGDADPAFGAWQAKECQNHIGRYLLI